MDKYIMRMNGNTEKYTEPCKQAIINDAAFKGQKIYKFIIHKEEYTDKYIIAGLVEE